MSVIGWLKGLFNYDVTVEAKPEPKKRGPLVEDFIGVDDTAQSSSLPPTIRDRFEEFHEQNPQVYERLVKLARQAKGRGYTKYSVKTLIEIVRWSFIVDKGYREFSIDNNFSSSYAREIMKNEPDLADFFETRSLRKATV